MIDADNAELLRLVEEIGRQRILERLIYIKRLNIILIQNGLSQV